MQPNTKKYSQKGRKAFPWSEVIINIIRSRRISKIILMIVITLGVCSGDVQAQPQSRQLVVEFKEGVDILKAIEGIKQKHKIAYIRTVFDKAAVQATQDNAALDRIKEKFPNRSKRIPPNSSLPNLGVFYLIEFRKDVDIESVQAELLSSPDIKSVSQNFVREVLK